MSSVLYDAPGPRARIRSAVGSVLGGAAIIAFILYIVLRLNERGELDIEKWQVLWDPPRSSAEDVWESLLLTGLLQGTLAAAGMAAVLALIGGVILVILRSAKSPFLSHPMNGVIEVFRGIPVVLLMFFGVLGLGLPILHGVVFGLVVYNSAVIAEILRAGIVSLPRGQAEAAGALGLTQSQTLFQILLPQAIRRMLPSLISQLVVLLKDTSLGFIIGYVELLRVLRLNREYFGEKFTLPLFLAGAVIYILVNITLSRVAIWVEKRGTKKAAGGVAHADPAHAEAGNA